MIENRSLMKPFKYKNKLLYFKGGGSGDTYDAAYNERMATLAEDQQGMAEEYFNFWKSDYQPMEQAQIAANTELIPLETEQKKAEINSAMKLLPAQTDFAMAQMDDQLNTMAMKQPVTAKFFDEALEGVDINAKADKAAADAAHAFASSTDILNRNAARMGVNPTSGRFSAMNNTNSMNRAKTISSAKTTARTNAEENNFNRLNTAMSYGGTA